MASFKDISGVRFDSLVASSFSHSDGNGALWNFVCDYGGKRVSYPHAAKTTGHCGCKMRQNLSARFATHGMSATSMYKAWFAMKDRCTNKSNIHFADYGGRGISVCRRWMDSFEDFLSDMGHRPKGMTIDRIDNNGNYEPGNCRWASRKEQQRNRRVNHVIDVNGNRKCVSEWAEEIGVSASVIHSRLRRGWSVEKAVTTPRMKQGAKCNA